MGVQLNLWWVHMLMVLTIFLIATSFPVGSMIAHALPADVMMLVRFLIAAILFAPIVFYRQGIQLPTLKKLGAYALVSIPLVVFFWCMFEALKYTSAINTGALYTLVPAMTAIFGLGINRERISFVTALGLFIGSMGALWIIFRGDFVSVGALELNYGDSVFFIGAVSLSMYNPLIKRVYTGEAMEVMTFWVILLGTVWLFLLSLPNLKGIDWQHISLNVYGGLFYLALFTTLVSFFSLQYGTVKIGPTNVAAYSFLNPIFVVLITVVLGVEELTWQLLPGVLFVLCAMFCIQWRLQKIVE
jgi:drug/metabolite transporter (DMT)-like permease